MSADPNSVDDLAKVAGGGGAAALVAAVVAFMRGASTANRIDALTAQMVALSQQVSDLNGKLTVLLAASERRDAEHDRLDAEKRFASLEARLESVEKMLERLDRSHREAVAQ